MRANEVVEAYRKSLAGLLEEAIKLMRSELTPDHSPSVDWHRDHLSSVLDRHLAIGLFLRRWLDGKSLGRLEAVEELADRVRKTVSLDKAGRQIVDSPWITRGWPDELEQILNEVREVRLE